MLTRDAIRRMKTRYPNVVRVIKKLAPRNGMVQKALWVLLLQLFSHMFPYWRSKHLVRSVLHRVCSQRCRTRSSARILRGYNICTMDNTHTAVHLSALPVLYTALPQHIPTRRFLTRSQSGRSQYEQQFVIHTHNTIGSSCQPWYHLLTDTFGYSSHNRSFHLVSRYLDTMTSV